MTVFSSKNGLKSLFLTVLPLWRHTMTSQVKNIFIFEILENIALDWCIIRLCLGNFHFRPLLNPSLWRHSPNFRGWWRHQIKEFCKFIHDGEFQTKARSLVCIMLNVLLNQVIFVVFWSLMTSYWCPITMAAPQSSVKCIMAIP